MPTKEEYFGKGLTLYGQNKTEYHPANSAPRPAILARGSRMGLPGYATPEGTDRYRQRFAARPGGGSGRDEADGSRRRESGYRNRGALSPGGPPPLGSPTGMKARRGPPAWRPRGGSRSRGVLSW